MLGLIEEIQLAIIGYLVPTDVKTLYESSNQFGSMIDNLAKYHKMEIKSTDNKDFELDDWFKSKKIHLNVMCSPRPCYCPFEGGRFPIQLIGLGMLQN